jgi:hypothetical protein
MAKTCARLGVVLASLVLMLLALASPAQATAPSVKPPAPVPTDIASGSPGVDTKTGHYCDQTAPKYQDPKKGRARCRPIRPGEIGGTVEQGEGSANPADALKYELKKLDKWRDAHRGDAGFKKLNKAVTACVKKGETFIDCEGRTKSAPPETLNAWISGKISEAAADAVQEVAAAMGDGAAWLLRQFADSYSASTEVKLTSTGIGPVMSITTGLSAVLGTFLLLIQWGKVAATQSGESAATALMGLVKYGLILTVYVVATQAALDWSHTLSTSLINFTFEGGGQGGADAHEAMRKQLGTLFASLTGAGGAVAGGAALISGSGVVPGAVGAVIILAILCIIAIGALWLEMLMRQAGIMILVAVMPLALAGQMADGTKEWWPKARAALIALILMDPVIVIVFSVGFSAMAGGQGVKDVLVGLIIFVTAAFSWPVLAKFVVVSSVGEGSGGGSGLLSSIGSSMSSSFGGMQPLPSGAGTVGGGGQFAKAVEADNAAHGGGDGSSRSGWSKAMLGGGSSGFGGFKSNVGSAVGMGLQAAAVGKDLVESAAANTAAHAGLGGQGSAGGRHVMVNRRGGGGGGSTAPPPPREDEAAASQAAQPVQPSTEAEPPPEPPSPDKEG